jgi:hypothetical protein
MLKKLLLMGVLLAPAVAYAGSPASDFSVQIAPASRSSGGGSSGGGSGGSSAGGGGDSGGGSPTAPAAALAGCQAANGGGPTNGSCFNTLALNMDFTGATQSGLSNGTKFNAATSSISTWLNCSGGGTSTIWELGGGGQGNNAPCSAWTIVNDSVSGEDALLMSYDTNQAMTTTNAFPNEFYIQFTMRVQNSTSEANCNGSTNCQDVWMYNECCGYSAPISTFEWDFVEQGANTSNTAGAAGGWNLGLPNQVGFTHYWNNVPSFDIYQYHTLGIRVTQDGNGNQTECYYYDGVQYNLNPSLGQGNCVTTNPPDDFGSSSYLNNMSTPAQLIAWNAISATGTVNTYIQSIQVWECPNWTEAQNIPVNPPAGWACAGALISSNP